MTTKNELLKQFGQMRLTPDEVDSLAQAYRQSVTEASYDLSGDTKAAALAEEIGNAVRHAIDSGYDVWMHALSGNIALARPGLMEDPNPSKESLDEHRVFVFPDLHGKTLKYTGDSDTAGIVPDPDYRA